MHAADISLPCFVCFEGRATFSVVHQRPFRPDSSSTVSVVVHLKNCKHSPHSECAFPLLSASRMLLMNQDKYYQPFHIGPYLFLVVAIE